MMKPLAIAITTFSLIACVDQAPNDELGNDSSTHIPSDGKPSDNNGSNQGDVNHPDIEKDVISLTPEMMKKTAFYFSDTLPSATELENMDAASYANRVDTLLTNQGFSDRIVEIFEDKLMSDKYLAANGRDGAINLLNNRDYPNRKWYDKEFEDQNTIRNCVRDLTNDALADASIELIRHIVETSQPFSEILTADYMMVNYYSAKALDAQVIGNSDFTQLETPVCIQTNSGEVVNSIAFDPTDFRPARIEHAQQRFSEPVAHAGILSDVVFLNRYPTTDTNRNRHRARILMDYFLDFDILSIDKDRTADPNDSVNAIPTLENPDCTICHNMLDPIASVFRNRNATGRIIPVELNRGDNAWNLDDILEPGFLGRKAPEETKESYALLPWLAQQVVNDVRFPRAMVKTLYKGLYGFLPDQYLVSAEDYSEYEALIEEAKNAFISNNMDIRAAAKVMVEHELWANAQKTDQAYTNLKRRLVTPEILNKKLELLTGSRWDDLDTKSREIMFGGVDSDSVTERLTDPNGIYSKMQNRMAVEMACKTVAGDLALPSALRKLFPYVEIDTSPIDAEGNFDMTALQAIKQNVQYLHQHLLNEKLALTDQELLYTYQLFMDTQRNGLERLANRDDYEPRPLTSLHSACSIPSNHPALADMIGNNAQATELRSVRYSSRCLGVDNGSLRIQECSGDSEQTWITQNDKVVWGADTDMCMTTESLSNGGDLYLAECEEGNYLQNWKIQGAQLRNGNFAADVSGNNQSNVHTWTTHGGTNQMWSVDGTDLRSDINQDEQYIVRSWMAVITYLLSDALFIYE